VTICRVEFKLKRHGVRWWPKYLEHIRGKSGLIRESWCYGFPRIDNNTLFLIEHRIDDGFRAFTSAEGDAISALFQPLDHSLIGVDFLPTQTPWAIVILFFAGLVWLATRAWRLVVFMLIRIFGMWNDAMLTVAMIVVATTLSVVFGIGMSHSDVLQRRASGRAIGLP
jgi:ABC-type proline/glycine betaine transport system permease subunit